jgi:hypothetical protein
MNPCVYYLQCNFSHQLNVCFEEQDFNKYAMKYARTGSPFDVDRYIVARWEVKIKTTSK